MVRFSLAHSPPLPRASSAWPPLLPPFRARLRVTLLWTSGWGAGALTCEKRSSVASFLKPWQLLSRMHRTTREWHDSCALRYMLAAGWWVSWTRGSVAWLAVARIGAALVLGWDSQSEPACFMGPVRLQYGLPLRCGPVRMLRLAEAADAWPRPLLLNFSEGLGDWEICSFCLYWWWN